MDAKGCAKNLLVMLALPQQHRITCQASLLTSLDEQTEEARPRRGAVRGVGNFGRAEEGHRVVGIDTPGWAR